MVHARDGSMIDWSDETGNAKEGISKIFGHIIWLLRDTEWLIESEKPVKMMRLDQ